MYIYHDDAPDNGEGTQSYTWTFRLNSENQALTCAIEEAETTANDTVNTVSCSAGEYVSVEAAPANTPTTSDSNFGVTCYIAPPAAERRIMLITKEENQRGCAYACE